MISRDTQIIVPNWDKFQHYKDRTPSWIKVYTELGRKREWLDLTYAQRGLLVTIWCTYADHRRRLMVADLTIGAPLRRTYVHLKALNDAGWIELRASTREEKNRKGASASRESPDPAVVAMLHDQLAAWSK